MPEQFYLNIAARRRYMAAAVFILTFFIPVRILFCRPITAAGEQRLVKDGIRYSSMTRSMMRMSRNCR
jgi:hypothetical protein